MALSSITLHVATPTSHSAGYPAGLGYSHSVGPSLVIKVVTPQVSAVEYLWSLRDGNMQGFLTPWAVQTHNSSVLKIAYEFSALFVGSWCEILFQSKATMKIPGYLSKWFASLWGLWNFPVAITVSTCCDRIIWDSLFTSYACKGETPLCLPVVLIYQAKGALLASFPWILC